LEPSAKAGIPRIGGRRRWRGEIGPVLAQQNILKYFKNLQKKIEK
jgi:hypothetical protein